MGYVGQDQQGCGFYSGLFQDHNNNTFSPFRGCVCTDDSRGGSGGGQSCCSCPRPRPVAPLRLYIPGLVTPQTITTAASKRRRNVHGPLMLSQLGRTVAMYQIFCTEFQLITKTRHSAQPRPLRRRQPHGNTP